MPDVCTLHLTDVIGAVYKAHSKQDRERRCAADARGVELALADLEATGAPADQLTAIKQVRDGTKKLDDLRAEKKTEDVYYAVLEHRGGGDGIETLWEFVRGLLRERIGVKAAKDSFVEHNWEKFDDYARRLELGNPDPASEFHEEIVRRHDKGDTPWLIGEIRAFCEEHGFDFDGLGLGVLESELGDANTTAISPQTADDLMESIGSEWATSKQIAKIYNVDPTRCASSLSGWYRRLGKQQPTLAGMARRKVKNKRVREPANEYNIPLAWKHIKSHADKKVAQ